MDQGQSGSARTSGTLPRLSRLPKILPRASQDNLRSSFASRSQDPVKSSGLPRPARSTTSSHIIPPRPLGENLNRSVKERYGWSESTQSQARSRSPVRDALQATQTSLDTTPPSSGSTLIIHEDGNENASNDQKDFSSQPLFNATARQGRKPRLSLSERTIETLSRVSPSPSPTRRRRSSMVTHTHDASMGPPERPASRMKQDGTLRSSSRPSSLTKQTFRPPGPMSPTREPVLPTITSPGSIYTPPRAFVKGGSARYARSTRSTDKPPKNSGVIHDRPPSATTRAPYSSKTLKVKSTSTVRSTISGKVDGKSSLESLFDPLPTATSGLAIKNGAHALSHQGSTKPKVPAQPPSSTRKIHSSKVPPESPTASAGAQTAPSKSSAALRQTIADAKAAKRAQSKPRSTANGDRARVNAQSESWSGPDSADMSSASTSLRQRLRSAVMTGHLNLAAMNLADVPSEVLEMYDSTKVAVTWSEMVDLSKVDFSGNQLTQISDEVFPDWSVKELEEDEDKTNQFAGLETLFLQHNNLTAIPIGLRRMEHLKTLNLGGNDFSMTNQVLSVIWQIPQLRNLSLAKSGLKGAVNLSTIGTEQLQSLDLSENGLTEIELTDGQLTTLQSLNLSSNQLETIPWTALAQCSLLDLKVASNRMHGTAFQGVSVGFDKLKDLDLSHNGFNDLGPLFCELKSLQSCAISGNSIETISDISALQRLTTFLLASNKLESIPQSIYSLTALRHVDLSNNEIKSIQPEVASMDALVSLNLDGNPLRQRNLLTMSTSDLKAHMQRRLEDQQPGASSAEQANTPARASKVPGKNGAFKAVNGVLDLSNRSLKTIDPQTIDFGSDTEHVHTLRLSNNDLTALPVELLQHPAISGHLRSLDISHNPHLHSSNYLLSEIHLPALQSLYVVSTGLTSLDALTTNLKAPELVELNISCHRIWGAIPNIRDYFPKCTILLASDNWFSSVTSDGIKGLEVLDIRNNQIDALPVDIGLLGNHDGRREAGRLRSFEVAGNPFRVPRIAIVEKGTEAVLRDLRRRIPNSEVPSEWEGEIQ